MALSGNYTHYTYTEDTSSYTNTDITYPTDLPADHPDYDKRGTTETIPVYDQVLETTEYTGSYIFITRGAISTMATTPEGENHLLTNIYYRVYDSKDSKDNDMESHLAEYKLDVQWDWDTDSNLWTKGYNEIKNLPGAGSLTDI